MATTIYFNGRVTAIPGSYSEVDASGLATLNLSASGIVACIGEAEGAEPGVVYNTTNPGKVTKLFKAGDLREAGNILFDPSKDPGIPGGAQEVKFIKLNPATQSSLVLNDDQGQPCLEVTSRDYGAFTEKISVQVGTGTSGAPSKRVIVKYEDLEEDFDDIGGEEVVRLEYNGNWTAEVDFASGGAGLVARGEHTTDSPDPAEAYIGSATLDTGANPSIVDLGNGLALQVASSDAGDTTQTVQVWGILNGVFVQDSATLNGANPVVLGNTNFDAVFAVQLDAQCVGNVILEDAGNNVALTITAGDTSYGLCAFAGPIEVGSAGALSLTTTDAGDNEPVLILGTAQGGGAQGEIVTLAGAGTVNSLLAWDDVQAIACGAVAPNRPIEVSGQLLNSGDQIVLVSTDNNDTTQTATVYGTDTNGAAQSENIQLTGQAGATTTGTWDRVYGVLLDGACAGTVTVSGQQDNVVCFEIQAGSTSAGLDTFNLPVSLTAQTVDWTSASGGEVLIVGLDQAGSPAVEVIDLGSGANGSTAGQWTSINRIATGHLPAGDSVDFEADLYSLPIANFPKLSDWSDFFDTRPDWAFSTIEPSPLTYDVASLDDVTGVSAGSGAGAAGLHSVLTAIAEALSLGSSFVVAEATGTNAPANIIPTSLAGGSEGVTLFSHWQDALDQLRDYRVNTIVALTDNPAVHAAVVSHCNYMCGPGRSERDCLLGAPSGTTLEDGKASALALNTRHARLFIQDVKRFNVSGEIEQFAPAFTACVAAGMQAGSDVGTSLTFKYLNVLETVEDGSYTIKDDANELIQGGLCLIEKVPGKGYRWLRNNTTHLIDNNLAYVEASVNEAVNYTVFNFRQSLETMVGKKGFAGTVNATLSICVGILGELINVGAITQWRNLTIELNNDVMTIDVEIAPIIPVNFIKSTIHLVSASFSAGA